MQQLIDAITNLHAGQKAWFWLSEAPIDDAPMLMVTPFSAHKPMQALRDEVAQIDIPLGTITATGLLFVDHEGRLTLGAPGLSTRMLENLARWVADNIATYPQLNILKDLSMTVLDYQGVSRAVHRNPQLWANLPDPPKNREIDRTIRLLAKLPANKNCWFWTTSAGLGGKPTFILRSTKKDPQAQAFSKTVRYLNGQCKPRAKTLKGTLFRENDGTIVFTTEADITEARNIITTLIDTYPQLEKHLQTAKLAQLSSQGIEKYIRVGRPPSIQDNLLSALTPEQKLYFWFTQNTDSGQPLLLLGKDSATVKQQAVKQQVKGKTLRGRLSLHEQGWVLFQSTADAPWFLEQLARWVQNNPRQNRLRFARLSCKTNQGKLLGRYKNDALWAKKE